MDEKTKKILGIGLILFLLIAIIVIYSFPYLVLYFAKSTLEKYKAQDSGKLLIYSQDSYASPEESLITLSHKLYNERDFEAYKDKSFFSDEAKEKISLDFKMTYEEFLIKSEQNIIPNLPNTTIKHILIKDKTVVDENRIILEYFIVFNNDKLKADRDYYIKINNEWMLDVEQSLVNAPIKAKI